MSHPNRGFLAPKWGTHHFWEIHICGAAPLCINAIMPIYEGLVAARMTLCAVVNTSHPHICTIDTSGKSHESLCRLKADEASGREVATKMSTEDNSFFPLHNCNFLYPIENVVCPPFRTATLVDNETIEGQIGEGCSVLP